ncbi:hypothetical protein GQ53DRAFT_743634 [Thozetella sp. PMI_491]|nr:hypothetical protein GQ53DRAFT_743634 [Thozetella sp. PMI_491]
MPTVKLPPDSNVTSKPPNWSSRRHYPGLNRSHIYLAVGAFFVLWLVFRFVSARKARSRGPANQSRIRTEKTQTHVQDRQANYRKDSPASYTTRPLWAVREGAPPAPGAQEEEPEGDRALGTEFGGGRALQGQVIWATGLLGPALPEGNWGSCGPLGAAQAMDGRGDQRWDAASGPGQQASRGVSISPGAAEHLLRHQESPSPADAAPSAHSQRRRNSRSPGLSTSAASRRHSESSDGNSGASRNKSKAKGKGKSTEHSDDGVFWPGFSAGTLGDTMGLQHTDGAGMTQELGFVGVDLSAASRRLPPPPPITPPALTMGSFTFQDRRPSYAVSIPPQLDTSFVHQPNPDYFGSSTSADMTSSSPKSATSSPGTRRRSYNKSVPIGIPNTLSASSQGSSLALTSADTFSPASYPPTSPLLPPPPPGHEFGYDPLEYAFDDPNAPPVVGASGEIDLQGEIISVMDGSGRGWKRHTRVYGGGVCLACVASGGQHGGFYGDKVPPEQRR